MDRHADQPDPPATRLVCPVTVRNTDHAHAAAVRAAELGADAVEFRIDGFDGNDTDLLPLILHSPVPCIVTLRSGAEGGEDHTDQGTRRERLLTLAREAKPAWIDVELRDLDAGADAAAWLTGLAAHSRVILSSHDFDSRPADLERRVGRMVNADGASVLKVAWRARSIRDNLEAFELIDRRVMPTVALCMGESGVPSRVLARKFNAAMTFAALDDASRSAPGQPTLHDMHALYRWRGLGRDTRVFGVIGSPIAHSRSPHIHNAGFQAVGFDGVYLHLPIPPEYEHFKASVLTWLDMPGLHFRGASVTLPHKANLLRFVEERGGTIDPVAARIGAANTLTVSNDGHLRADNSDMAAILTVAAAAMLQQPVLDVDTARAALRGVDVAVLGAGGAARAAVAGLTDAGAQVTIFNRSEQRRTDLANEFGARHAPLASAPEAEAALWINTTSVGMSPEIESTPLPQVPRSWDADTVVFDTVYTPPHTRLLRDAETAGCRTAAGTDMFIHQAAAQFTRWTGRPAPVDVMRGALSE